MSTTEAPDQPEAQTEVAGTEDPTVDRARRLFHWSTWVHVGVGAEGCAEVNTETGEITCADPLHFHAWCRLPNPMQHEEIRTKAMAAKARRVRQLRDPETDAGLILDDDMDQLARGGDTSKSAIVEELLNKEWFRHYTEATREVAEEENEEGEKVYEHIAQDQQRYTELRKMEPEERPSQDEYDELERHVDVYGEKVDKAVTAIQKPHRDALEARDINDLVDEIREQRVQLEATRHFMHTYNTYEWLFGTLRRPGGDRVFDAMEALQASAPEVIDAIQATFTDLERSRNEEAQGNS